MAVQTTEHLWIPLSDGTLLVARLWLPRGAQAAPVPAILEYIPYRKRDGTRGRDSPCTVISPRTLCGAARRHARHRQIDGLMDDEYLRQEQTTRWR